MGVDRSDFILVGASLDASMYNDDLWEQEDCIYEKYSVRRNSKPGDNAIIFDGMSGRYFIAGVLIDVDPEGYNGLGRYFHDENSKEFQETKVRATEFIKEHFDIEVEPQLIIMTHWS